jgi:hypothetical protein
MPFRVHWRDDTGPRSAWAEAELDARDFSRQLKANGIEDVTVLEATSLDKCQRQWSYKADWPTVSEIGAITNE